MFDGKAFGETVVGMVKQAITEGLGGIRERLAVVEARKGTDALETEVAQLRERLARLEERKPEKGEPGRDGLSVEDFDVCVLDDDRTIQLSLKAGDVEHVATLKWPTVIDRGVYKQGKEYEQGDGVSFGGCFWIAQKETSGKPGEGDDWRLAVKKGRDAK